MTSELVWTFIYRLVFKLIQSIVLKYWIKILNSLTYSPFSEILILLKIEKKKIKDDGNK